jgi:hypothetical protein
MDNGQLNWITNFIWGIADDVLGVPGATVQKRPFGLLWGRYRPKMPLTTRHI